MGVKWFLAIAAVAFLVSTVGPDVFASVIIGGQPFSDAVSEHFYWAVVEFGGTLMLFAPFGFLAVIAAWVEKKTRTLWAVLLFAAPSLYLLYAYFEGYQASQVAALHKAWTAATFSIAFLSFWAAPVVLIDWLAALILIRLRNRGPNDQALG